MGAYFKPWRRKAGCVTLALVAVLGVEWLKSQLVCEGYFRFGEKRNHSIMSVRGGIVWQWSPEQPNEDPQDHHRWHSAVGTSKGLDRSKYRLRCFGFEIREYVASWGNGQPITEYAIPYWSIVLPLSLLSAYLLLSKPRPQKPAVEQPT